MRFLYALEGECLRRVDDTDLRQALWIDLFDPTETEETEVEAELGFSIPTRADMSDLEDSSRLYDDEGAAVMTAVVITGVKEGRPCRSQVTFILTGAHLVTVRYTEAAAIQSVAAICEKTGPRLASSDAIFVTIDLRPFSPPV